MPVFSRIASASLVVCLAAVLAACETQPRQPRYDGRVQQSYPSQQQSVEYGTVTNIEELYGRSRPTGVGAILGAVVGGVLGNQVGKGSGRAAATAIGAVGGAVAGNAIEERRDRNQLDGYRIVIQTDRGERRIIDVPDYAGLRTGDRVRLRGGEISRL